MTFDYREFLKTVPNRPGSYRMYGDENTVIYVGKAKDLKKRLSQYFLREVNVKTRALVEHIHHIEFTVTFSETEALILENNLIKQYQPHYNILLRDDKSYPYILLSRHRHPGLFYHRGAKKKAGEYFGPFPDASAVKESLKLLQKLFPLRQCTDNVYAHRSRPCLMAQLGKCLAPCVKLTDEEEQYYQEQVELVRMFLKGQNQALLNNLSERMESLSSQLKFEEAARVRDQLLALRHVQESQAVAAEVDCDLDVIAQHTEQGLACVHVLFIRSGRILGTRSYFPKLSGLDFEEDILATFLEQFYLSDQRGDFLPQEILLDHELSTESLQEAIYQKTGQKIRFTSEVRGQRARFIRLAVTNAQASLKARLISAQNARMRIEALEELLKLKGVEHLECFDISHTMGELTVASCVNFNREGPDPTRYRRFNIEGITPGDDFAAMYQVLTRRYKDPDSAEIPEVIFIDGGKGQLKQAEEVIGDLFSHNQHRPPLLVGVAKGEGRKEGLETLIVGYTHEQFHLDLSSPALQLVLHIRDEAHRFAITGHRQRRQKARVTSRLEGLPGIGPKRRQALLKHLGGMQEVMRAGLDDLKKVPGISAELAERIYDALHDL